MLEDGKVRPEGCICEPCSDIPPNWKDIRTMFVYKPLNKISNSPSLRNGNLNHRTGLTSLNDNTGGKNMCLTAPQPNITPVKRLTPFAQIFIKQSEKLLLSKKISLSL
jgi:hypothetical protein